MKRHNYYINNTLKHSDTDANERDWKGLYKSITKDEGNCCWNPKLMCHLEKNIKSNAKTTNWEKQSQD